MWCLYYFFSVFNSAHPKARIYPLKGCPDTDRQSFRGVCQYSDQSVQRWYMIVYLLIFVFVTVDLFYHHDMMVSYFYIFLVVVPLMWIISASGACHALAFISFVLCCWLSTLGTLASFAMYLFSTRSHNIASICRFTASRIPFARLEHLHLVGFWPVCSSNIVRIKNRWWQVRCREHKVFYMKLVQNNEASELFKVW